MDIWDIIGIIAALIVVIGGIYLTNRTTTKITEDTIKSIKQRTDEAIKKMRSK